ncbi:lateral signaling target protein 2 homolog [Anneissia japonica]|uniref:lateral signaling target protein 2 homolog n=1 Tax=Anneissia japonica TaxID=1529436 RepID=UPI0014256181|nr:lateral signaling target protein 2 homolog [Anneissia japonica]
MFTLPRLVIVCGLVIFPDGPLNVDMPASQMSELFRPYQHVLRKIRELLCTLTSIELHLLEKALSSTDLSWEDIEKELVALNGTSASQAIPRLHGRTDNHIQSPIRSIGQMDMFGQSPASVSTLTERSTLCSSFPTDYDLDQVMARKSSGNDFSDQMLEYLVADSIPFSGSTQVSDEMLDSVQKLKDARENINNARDNLIDDSNLPTIQVNSTTETNGDDSHNNHKRCRRSSERRRSSGSNNGCHHSQSRRRSSSQCNGTDALSSSLSRDSALTEEIIVQSQKPGEDDSANSGSKKAPSSRNKREIRTSESGTSSDVSDKEPAKKCYLTANGRNRSGANTECSSREGSDDAGTTLGRKGSEPDENILLECKARLTNREYPTIAEYDRPTAELNKKSTLELEMCSDYTMTRFLSDLENAEYYDHTSPQSEMLLEAEDDDDADVFYLSKSTMTETSHSNVNGIKSHTRTPSVASSGSSMSSLSQNRIVGHHAGAGLKIRSRSTADTHGGLSDDGEEYDDDDECSTCSCSTCALSEAQNDEFKWESDDSGSDSTSYLSDNHDDREIAMAIEAAEQAAKEETRSRFSSTSDLVHRLFVCVAGVADQLQSNYVSDLRNILKTVFEVKCLDPFDLSNLVQTLPENNLDENTTTFLNHINPSASPLPEVFEERHRNGSGHSGRGDERCTRHSSGDRRVRHNSNHSGRAAGDERRRHNSSRSRNKSGQRVEGLPSWQPDEQCTHCYSCKGQFTVLRRKHHCRNCGKIFCARCSANSVPLPRYGQRKAVRVCNRCYMFHVTPFQQ